MWEGFGLNLYSFVINNCVNFIDYLGLKNSQKSPDTSSCCSNEEMDKKARRMTLEATAKTRLASDRFGLKMEFCGLICCKDGDLRVSFPHAGPRTIQVSGGRCNPNEAFDDPTVPYYKSKGGPVFCSDFGPGWKQVGAYHSHPYTDQFSGIKGKIKGGGDVGWANSYQQPLYMGAPNGKVYRLDPYKPPASAGDDSNGRILPAGPIFEIPEPPEKPILVPAS